MASSPKNPWPSRDQKGGVIRLACFPLLRLASPAIVGAERQSQNTLSPAPAKGHASEEAQGHCTSGGNQQERPWQPESFSEYTEAISWVIMTSRGLEPPSRCLVKRLERSTYCFLSTPGSLPITAIWLAFTFTA